MDCKIYDTFLTEHILMVMQLPPFPRLDPEVAWLRPAGMSVLD